MRKCNFTRAKKNARADGGESFFLGGTGSWINCSSPELLSISCWTTVGNEKRSHGCEPNNSGYVPDAATETFLGSVSSANRDSPYPPQAAAAVAPADRHGFCFATLKFQMTRRFSRSFRREQDDAKPALSRSNAGSALRFRAGVVHCGHLSPENDSGWAIANMERLVFPCFPKVELAGHSIGGLVR